MKTLVYLFLVGTVLLYTACEKTNDAPDSIKDVRPTTSLSDEQIKEKVALYYSNPSTLSTPGDTIQAEFNQQFPNASDVEWESSNGVYEVDFDINDVDFEAWYDGNAALIMYKYDIGLTELPVAVQNAIANDYPGYRTDDAEKVHKGSVTGYLVEIEIGNSEMSVYYKEDGTFIANSIRETDYKPGGDDTGAPVSPVDNGTTTSTYTDAQIDALLAQYFAAQSVDTMPGAAVTNLFGQQFPNARDIEWEVAGEIYNVDFEISNVDYEAWYDKNGLILMYTYDIRQTALPETVKAAVATKYPGYRIDDVEKAFKGATEGYSIEVEKGQSEIDAFFKEDGTFVNDYVCS